MSNNTEKTGSSKFLYVLMVQVNIAVVAETLDAAMKGKDVIGTNWDKGSHPQMDTASVEASFIKDLEKPGANVVTRGDIMKALAEAKKTHEATYYIPCVSHATMEPQTCTADGRADRCDVYISTQGQTISHMVATIVSGLPPEKVHIHTTLLGCGLGRRPRPDQLIEVSVDANSGRIQVHRVDVAVECGPVVNPDPLEAQIQGAVALGVSTTLFEEVQNDSPEIRYF